MKRKLMCLILSLCMVTGIVSGCSSSENTLLNNAITSKKSEESNTVRVTKKLEEEYVERMEAYLAYYQEQDTDTTGVIITLDEDHLPLMWLCYGDDDMGWDGIRSIQLLEYKDDKVEVLAEKNNTVMIPILSDHAILAAVIERSGEDYNSIDSTEIMEEAWNEAVDMHSYNSYVYLVYDDEKEDFKQMYADELIQNTKGIVRDLDSDGKQNIYCYYVKNGEVAYLFYAVVNDEYYSSIFEDSDQNDVIETTEIDYMIRESVQVDLSAEEVSELVNQINSDSDTEEEKEEYSYFHFYKPNGEEISANQVEKTLDCIYENYEIHTNLEEINEYWSGVEAESLMRYLAKHPAYTTGDMLAVLHAVHNGYSVIDADTIGFDNMTIDTAEYDGLKQRIIELVETTSFSYNEVDEISNDVIGADISPLQRDALREDINLLYAKLDEAAENVASWKKIYLSAIDNGTIWLDDYSTYDLTDINNNGIPELLHYEGMNTFIYTIDNNELKELVYDSGCSYIINDMAYYDGRFRMTAYKMNSDNTVDVLFYAEDINRDGMGYDYEGNKINYEEAQKEASKVLGVDVSILPYPSYPYNKDSIRNAIVNY